MRFFNDVGAFQNLLNGFKVRDEEVSVIVGHFVLQYGHQALQTHPCVDALLRQRLQHRLRLSEKVGQETVVTNTDLLSAAI